MMESGSEEVAQSAAGEYGRVAVAIGLRVGGVIVSLLSAILTARGLGVHDRGVFYTCTAAAMVAAQLLAFGMPSAVVLVVAPRQRLARQAMLRAVANGVFAGAVFLVVLKTISLSGAADWIPAPVFALAAVTSGFVATQVLLYWCSAITQGLGHVHALPKIEIAYRSASVLWVLVALFVIHLRLIAFLYSVFILDSLYCGCWLIFIALHSTGADPSQSWPRQWRAWSARAYGPLLLTSSMRRVDVLLLTALAGASSTGLYSVATQAVDALLIGAVFLGQTAFFRFSAGHGDSALLGQARRLLPAAVFLGMVTAALTAGIWAPRVFGRGFAGVGPVILALAPGSAALAWQTVAVQEVNATGFPIALTLAWSMTLAIAVSALTILVPRYGAVGAGIASSLSYVVLALLIYRLRGGVRLLQRADHDHPKAT